MNIPEVIRKGDNRSWKDQPQSDDFNTPMTSDIWILNYALRGAGAPVDIIATPDGEGWISNLTTEQSGTLTAPGSYTWVAFLQQGADATTRYTIGQGEIYVMEDVVSQGAGYDGRSPLEIIIAGIDTCLAARSQDLVPEKLIIAGRSRELAPIPQLIILRAEYVRRLGQERRKEMIKQGGDPRTVTAKFRGIF